ncbi:MAG: hypothetical protein VYE15_00890, partial [Myxococcota bacterium]|nr:hypothetical protein [Myxococcota bacterium]
QSYDLNVELQAITPVSSGPSEAETSIVRSWWFWTAVGGVAAIGITAALMASNPDPQQAGLLPNTEVLTVGNSP